MDPPPKDGPVSPKMSANRKSPVKVSLSNLLKPYPKTRQIMAGLVVIPDLVTLVALWRPRRVHGIWRRIWW